MGRRNARPKTYQSAPAAKITPARQQQLAQRLARAVELHQAGQLQQARAEYQQLLEYAPEHPDLLHLLGVIAHQSGDHDTAVTLIRRALVHRPIAPSFHCNLGNALRELGYLAEAGASYQEALRLKPDFVEVYNNLGVLFERQGELEVAREAYAEAVRLQPDFAGGYNNLGNILRRQGAFDAARQAYQEALRLQPDFHEALNNLGILCQKQGDWQEACTYYKECLRLQPDYAFAHNNLGIVLQHWGELEAATRAYQEAVRRKPDYAAAFNNLGAALREQGELDAALAACQEALRLQPQYPEAYNNLGTVLHEQGAFEAALAAYQNADRLKPDCADVHFNLGTLYVAQKNHDAAMEQYREAIRLQPDHDKALAFLGLILLEENQFAEAIPYVQRAMQCRPTDGFRLRLATLLPVTYTSTQDVWQNRQHLISTLNQLEQGQLKINDPTKEFAGPVFYLAYQGYNDRDIQQQLARIYRTAYTAADVTYPRSPQRYDKPLIGFISAHLCNHTIGKLNHGIIANLSRDLFHVVVFSLGDRQDDIARYIRAHADAFVVLPKNLAAIRSTILQYHPDVLFYPDIGMEPVTYFLAMSRLAPVQCVTWGHPVTTGIPTMDYFISSTNLEPEDADEHYTETLVRLSTPPTYYVRPTLPAQHKTRADFGFHGDDHLYLCPQSLFKFHPDFDPILAAILRRDPQGQLVLLGGNGHRWTTLLLDRFQHTMPEVVERIRFLPRQDYVGFYSLLAMGDVMLDTLHFGGGNTTYEAVAFGTPVVTLPGAFMRGRVTAALYKKMGVLDCIASTPEEYVDLAVRLGTDKAYRARLSATLLANNHVLYEDIGMIRELEQFFLQALDTARARETSG
jgi:predicted O-linked N-acetylglucosamine transferase (SPINDLY family)